MKTLLTVIVDRALLATWTLATATDAAFEERFRAKTGLYTPPEEARRMSIANNAKNRDCPMPKMSCCTRNAHTQTTVAPNPWLNVKQPQPVAAVSAAETWHRAKYGHATNGTAANHTISSPTCCD